MICQATYDSLDAIPEALRDEFQQVSGKWQLKDTAIPGVGPLFNSALAANERKAVDQVKTRNTTIKELEAKLTAAEDKLAVLDTPGNKALSKEDSDLWDMYVKMGTPKEIETKLAELPSLKQAVEKQEAAESLSKIATAAAAAGIQINADVLTDWATSQEAKDKGITLLVKTVEQTDAKGAKVNVDVPYVRIEVKEDGTTKVSERELLPFAKEVLPEWKYAALTTAAVNSSKPVNGTQVSNNGGVRLPDLNSAQKAPEGNGNAKRPVDIANEERAKRPNAFSKPLMPVTSAGAMGKVA